MRSTRWMHRRNLRVRSQHLPCRRHCLPPTSLNKSKPADEITFVKGDDNEIDSPSNAGGSPDLGDARGGEGCGTGVQDGGGKAFSSRGRSGAVAELFRLSLRRVTPGTH